jgi:hypothetical protein
VRRRRIRALQQLLKASVFVLESTSKASKVSTAHIARRRLLRALQILRQYLHFWTSTKKELLFPRQRFLEEPAKRQ